MAFKLHICFVLALLLKSSIFCKAESGYHYERPTAGPLKPYRASYSYGTLPTIVPLPPLPALPPLPTAAPGKYQTHTQTLHQSHPPQPTVKSVAGSYLSAKQFGQRQPHLLNNQPFQHYGQRFTKQQQDLTPFSSPSPQITYSNGFPSAKAAVNNEQLQAVPQPLRIPYGKQAIVHYPASGPAEEYYEANGRQLKQYSVIEIIDNDIEQSNEPFLSTPFIDSYRATGTGATPTEGIDLRSNSSPDLPVTFSFKPNPGETIALGSGSLGFVRLPNGNIYLGSGSLGYVTGQQHTQSIKNARTRTGAKVPDALHFGHGALGDPISRNSVYRYK